MTVLNDAAKFDRHWYIMLMSSDDLLEKHMFDEVGISNEIKDYKLSDALLVYLCLKGQKISPAF